MFKKPRIIFIDDEPQWTSLAIESLSKDFEIITATSFSDAIQALESIPNIDLMVIDLHLSSGDISTDKYESLRLIERLKKDKPNIPVVAMTAFHDSTETEVKKQKPQKYSQEIAFISKDRGPVGPILLESIHEVIKSKKEALKESLQKEPEVVSLSDIRKILTDEIDKYSEIKEHTIHIPDEGYFQLIKPLIGYKRDIEKKIANPPYKKNVFLMMKFRTSNKELGDFIIETLQKYDFKGIRADQPGWNITNNVYNPMAVLYCCKYGIALFDEPEDLQAYSPNVAYELGMMHYQNKECLILRHSSLPSMPFDLIKDLYTTYEKDLQVRRIIENWVKRIAKE